MFLIIIGILALVSVLWAVWSLRDFSKHKKASHAVKKHLQKGRVIFHREGVQRREHEVFKRG